jgi:predicted metal-dependent phosphoesterase TrpH
LAAVVLNQKKKFYADLHIHSLYSDGSLSPFEIVNRCKERGLKVLSITDHDTVSGVEETIRNSQGNIEVIPAVEMSSNIRDFDIHIIGYYIDWKNGQLLEYLESFRKHRVERVKKIIANLSGVGVKLEFEQIRSLAKNCSLGRPHIAEVLVENGYVRSINEAFSRFLGYHSPYYVPKKKVHPRDVIRMIKACQGIAVIAHPGTINNEQLLYQLILDGAAGIEVWHPEHTHQCQRKLYEIALKNDLVMTGGSDCHGRRFGHVQIGIAGCSRDDVQRLKASRNVVHK